MSGKKGRSGGGIRLGEQEFPPLPCESLDATDCIEKRPALYGGPAVNYVTPKGVELCHVMRAQAMPLSVIAHKLGISKTTLSDCMRRQPELQEAMETGHGKGEANLILQLHRAAMSGFAPAAMFLLKTMYGHREMDAPPDFKPNIILHLNAPLDPDAYARVVAAGGVVPELMTGPPDELEGEVVPVSSTGEKSSG